MLPTVLLWAATCSPVAFCSAPLHDEPVLPPGFQLVTALDLPGLCVALEFAPGGALLLAEKSGLVHLALDGVLQATPVFDLRPAVNGSEDRGLLGLVLHPGFAPDGGPTSWMYLLYTRSPVLGSDPKFDADNKYSWTELARYPIHTELDGSLRADPLAGQVLLGERQASGAAPDAIASLHGSHGPGTLAFGNDGTLLVSSGDGAHFDVLDQGGLDAAGFDDWIDPSSGLVGPHPADQDCGAFRAQDLRSLSGKLLRLDPESGLGLASNPFFDGDPSSNASRVFALGLRNPYRLCVESGTGSSDPTLGDPGRVWIGDVGSNRFEELDCVRFPGANFGWPCFEGPLPSAGFGSLLPPSPNPHACLDCSSPRVGIETLPEVAWSRRDATEALPAGGFVDVAGQPTLGITGSCAIGGEFLIAGPYPAELDGSLIWADFGSGWLRRAGSLDASGALLRVHDFGQHTDALVDLARHPLSGELHLLQLPGTEHPSRVLRLVHALGLPQAALKALPQFGLAPLDVTLDAGASDDPDGGPLEYEFDFGDGSGHQIGTASSAQHTYTADGAHLARVTVRDPDLNLSSAEALVVVGALEPQVAILLPDQLAEPELPGTLALSGLGLDPLGEDVDLEWRVDVLHNGHAHPESYFASGALTSLQLDTHAAHPDLFYLRVELTGSVLAGASASQHVFVVPAGQTLDPTGVMRPLARALDEGAVLIGAANHDVEVFRDGLVPGAAAAGALDWFSSECSPAAPLEDWIGFEFVELPPEHTRLIEAAWTLGQVDERGGWLLDPRVETRIDGIWTAVQGLTIDPGLDPGGAPPAGFSSLRLRFDPALGDALRVIGTPGGSAHFMGASELRLRAISSAAFNDGWRDLTPAATPIAAALDLPASGTSAANPDPWTFVNGSFAVPGSSSAWVSFDSAAAAPLAGEDWYGVEFDVPRTLDAARLQLGLAHDGGGTYEDLRLEWRGAPAGPWMPVQGASFAPAFGGPGVDDFAQYEISFDPVAASGLRAIGTPSAPASFGSIAELRVLGPDYGPAPQQGCSISTYADPLGSYDLTLASDTPPVPGQPLAVQADGAPAGAVGALLYARKPGALQLGSGLVLLVDPLKFKQVLLHFDDQGRAFVPFKLPLAGPGGGPAFPLGLRLQAVAFDPGAPAGLRFSRGLLMLPCSSPSAQ